MTKAFIDASVIFAASYSKTGSARELIYEAIRGRVTLFVSEFVLEETRRSLLRKAPKALDAYEQLLAVEPFKIVRPPTKAEILRAAKYTPLKDAPIVAAAKKAKVRHLVTFDRKHLLGDPAVARKSGLEIVTPDTFLSSMKH
jgi:predicted nucleic acid-binding protein